MGKRRQRKSDWRAEFEVFLSRTAIGQEYLAEVNETANDLRENVRRSYLSKERVANKGTLGSTSSDTGTTS